jgi:hypothetical protein
MVLLALPAILLGGCTHTLLISVAPNNPIKPIYEQGAAVLRSQKKHAVVLRLLTPEFRTRGFDGLPTFYVAIANLGDHELDISTANITATAAEKPVHVYTFEELKREIKHEADEQRTALAMAAAAQSIAASVPQQTYSSGTATAYGKSGTTSVNYNQVATTYNPAATAAAQAQINASMVNQMAAAAASQAVNMDSLGGMLRRNTVLPGQVAAGVVKLDPDELSSSRPLVVLVTVDGETHEFVFKVDDD